MVVWNHSLPGPDTQSRMNDTTPQKDMAGEKGLDEIFDLEALAGATLHDEPYQYLVVPEFIRPAVYPTIHNDFPMVAGRGPFDPREHPGGPAFRAHD